MHTFRIIWSAGSGWSLLDVDRRTPLLNSDDEANLIAQLPEYFKDVKEQVMVIHFDWDKVIMDIKIFPDQYPDMPIYWVRSQTNVEPVAYGSCGEYGKVEVWEQWLLCCNRWYNSFGLISASDKEELFVKLPRYFKDRNTKGRVIMLDNQYNVTAIKTYQ